MDSKIAGVPLVLIVLIVVIVALIDGPMVLLHAQNQNRFNQAEVQTQDLQLRVNKLENDIKVATEAAVVTPTVSVTPKPAVRKVVPVTPTGQAQ